MSGADVHTAGSVALSLNTTLGGNDGYANTRLVYVRLLL